MQSVNIKITELSSTIGSILKRYEIIIKAISISNAWHALYLIKYGTLGFLTTPANKIKNNNNPLNLPNPPYWKVTSMRSIGRVI